MFVICVEAMMYLLLYNLHDSTFKGTESWQTSKFVMFQQILLLTLASITNLGLKAVQIEATLYLLRVSIFFLPKPDYFLKFLIHFQTRKKWKWNFKRNLDKMNGDFCTFGIVSLYQEWNRTKLLSPESKRIRRTSCFISCLTAEDLQL